MKNKYKYPEKFYNFVNGVNIDENRINEWIQEGVESIKKQLAEGKKSVHYFTATGNSIVWLRGYVYKKGKCELDIVVSKNYSSLTKTLKFKKGKIKKRMDEKDEKLLMDNGWAIECESPLEIRNVFSDDFATGKEAKDLLKKLKGIKKKKS